MPCLTLKCIPTTIFGGVDIPKVPGCHLLWQMSSWWGSRNLLKGLVSHTLTFYLSDFYLPLCWLNEMVISSKVDKLGNFESQNSLKRNQLLPICMVLQFLCRRNFLLHRTYLYKIGILLLFPLLITIIVFGLSFLCYYV